MRKKITIVGGGACALMLACELNTNKFEVTVYEKNAALGRKFLVAGDGGLNLTHSEDPATFITRYSPSAFLINAFTHFNNQALRNWFQHLGVTTYVGTSGRVFPIKGLKPIEVLNLVQNKIKRNNAIVHFKYELVDVKNNILTFAHNQQFVEVESDVVIYCMGGASWPVTGSTGNWQGIFTGRKISVNPFMPSNCAFNVAWPNHFATANSGSVLKNISITCEGNTNLGEVVLTEAGIEGSGIYPLSPVIRKALLEKGSVDIEIDLKPQVQEAQLLQKLASSRQNTSYTEHLKRSVNLSPVQIKLLKQFLSKNDFLNLHSIVSHIKNFKITLTGPGPIEEAISTVGGISLDEINPDFSLKKIPRHFVIGEMLDYDAPTGGYLLQSCFSMGNYLAHLLNSTNTY